MKAILLIIMFLLLISIVISIKLEEKEKIELKEEEKLKLMNDEEIKEKFGNDIEFTDIQDYGKIKIIYANIGNEELKIITSSYNYEKKLK